MPTSFDFAAFSSATRQLQEASKLICLRIVLTERSVGDQDRRTRVGFQILKVLPARR